VRAVAQRRGEVTGASGRTCSGCSSCIICLSDTRSHCAGGERPVSDSLMPTKSLILPLRLFRFSSALRIDLLYGP
jgi:hypothetical protein